MTIKGRTIKHSTEPIPRSVVWASFEVRRWVNSPQPVRFAGLANFAPPHFNLSPSEFSMFAIIKSGGKQYKLEVGKVVRLERISNPVGEEMELGGVILASNGGNLLDPGKVAVKGRVVSNARGKK